MKKKFFAAALAATSVACVATALADNSGPQTEDEGSRTIAVFGDWPYSQALLNNAHLLVNSINSDKAVKLVVHVGDIHSGSMPCTSAHIAYDYATKSGSPIPTSNPGWNQAVYYQFQQFERPVVYTPGDNEWTDCHKSKQSSSGAPLKELASVRELFFANPGLTLGQREKRVVSQAQAFDPAFPADSQFVENVMWEDSRIVFATFNMPGGSNNDTDRWSGVFADDAAQADEVAQRSAANLRWLAATFQRASSERARAVVIALQADMWDLEGGAAHLTNYTPFVTALADLSVQFGRPVLLLNGDSHVFKAENPLADPNSTLGSIHKTRAVPNLTRIVVEGSGVGTHWLRLSIDPRSTQAFSWQNVAY
jgi:hypothetical protein